MQVLSIYYLVVAFAFLSAFVAVLRFYLMKIHALPVEKRGELRPTLIILISFLVGLISTLIEIVSIEVGTPEWILIGELAAPLFGFTLFLVVVAALGRRGLIVIGLVLLALMWTVSLATPHPLQEPYRAVWVASYDTIVLIPALLFGYLWLTTRRSTSFALFVGFVAYNAYSATITVNPLTYGLIAVFLAVFCLSIISFSFLYYEKRIGGELLGYSISMPVIAVIVAAILSNPGMFGVVDMLYFILVASASAMMLLSGSYLYGRFRENPRAQTLALSLSLFLFGVALVLDNVLLMQPTAAPEWFDVTLSITLVSAGFLFLSAVYALELRRAARLPALVVIPFAFFEFALGSGVEWITLVTAALLLIFAILPICMFGVAWRKLRTTGRSGAARPLGLLVGLILLTVSDLVMFAFPLMSGILQVTGAAILLLAVTGSLDRWLYKQVR
jgi:hypothetical protein